MKIKIIIPFVIPIWNLLLWFWRIRLPLFKANILVTDQQYARYRSSYWIHVIEIFCIPNEWSSLHLVIVVKETEDSPLLEEIEQKLPLLHSCSPDEVVPKNRFDPEWSKNQFIYKANEDRFEAYVKSFFMFYRIIETSAENVQVCVSCFGMPDTRRTGIVVYS